MEFGAAFPADGESFELVEQGEGLLDDVAELAHALDVRGALAGDDGQDPTFAQLIAVGVGVVALVSKQGFRTPAGSAWAARDRWDAIDEGEGLGDVVDVRRGRDDFERGAASVADQMLLAARLPPVDRRRPVSAPPFSRGCVSRPRRPWTSRGGRPRSARRAGSGAAGRRPQPVATAPSAASRSVPSRTPAPAAGVARRCRCRARTGCLAGTAGRAPAAAPVTSPARAAAAARSMPTSRRSRSTDEYSHHPERPNRHTGHGRPGHFTKILLRALRGFVARRGVDPKRLFPTAGEVLPIYPNGKGHSSRLPSPRIRSQGARPFAGPDR